MAANEFKHKSILLDESVKWLITNKDGIYVDCTMGGAGHSFGFASQLNEDGMLIALTRTKMPLPHPKNAWLRANAG